MDTTGEDSVTVEGLLGGRLVVLLLVHLLG